MKQTNLTKNNISLAAKLLRIEEQKAFDKKQQLQEGGTPTQALPPETNATRQLQADVAAAMSKGGIPTPVGIEPKQNHGETDMGTQDPMGADSPASAPHGGEGQQDGMTRPPDQRGSGGQGPSSDTTATNATSGLGARSPKMEDFEKLEGAELVEAFVAICGGIEEAVFKLLAEGISLVEAETVLVDKKLEEGIFDKVKTGIRSAVGGGEKKPSSGYLDHLKKRNAGRPQFVKREQPWSATSNAGHDARRNK